MGMDDNSIYTKEFPIETACSKLNYQAIFFSNLINLLKIGKFRFVIK